jgi:signal transduction histidine kinase
VIAIEAGKLELELRSMAGTSPDVAEKLDLIKNQLIKASEDVHHISRQLHPSILDDLGLVRAIESECEILLRQEGIRITFIKDGEFSAVDKDVALCLYRIIQEGLKNIAKHSQARRAEIFLHNDGECINLTVRDKGIGFDPHEKRQKPGLGLSSMRERIQLVCGEFSIETRPGQGTIIRVSIPQRRCGV